MLSIHVMLAPYPPAPIQSHRQRGEHIHDPYALLVVLIEDIVAVNNLTEILTVDHIDVFFVAPSDLAQSMGHLGEPGHPEVQATIDKAIEQIINAGRTAGTLVNDANVEDYVKKGARFLMTGWPAWVASGARGFLGKVEAASRSA